MTLTRRNKAIIKMFVLIFDGKRKIKTKTLRLTGSWSWQFFGNHKNSNKKKIIKNKTKSFNCKKINNNILFLLRKIRDSE